MFKKSALEKHVKSKINANLDAESSKILGLLYFKGQKRVVA